MTTSDTNIQPDFDTSDKSKKEQVGDLIGLLFFSFIMVGAVTTISRTIFTTDYGIFLSIALGQIIGFGVIGTLYIKSNDTTILQALDLEYNYFQDGIAIILVTGVLTGMNYLTKYISTTLDINTATNTISPYLNSQINIILFILISMFIAGPFEEYMFRGIIQKKLTAFGSRFAIIIASLLFALIHIASMAGSDPIGYLLYLTTLFIGGLALGYSYEYTNNFLVPVISHGLYNTILAIALLHTL